MTCWNKAVENGRISSKKRVGRVVCFALGLCFGCSKSVVDPARSASMSPDSFKFSQVDSTEGFGDDKKLRPGEWMATIPLNVSVEHPEGSGLPAIGASADVVYDIADRLSRLRESSKIPRDGVYCPVCHIASVGLDQLRKPCPRCKRPLLEFGWD